MDFAKIRIFYFVIALVGMPMSFAAENKTQHPVTFPEITSWKNQPIIEFEQNKKALLKKDQQLKNAFVIKTAALDEVEIKFSNGDLLRVFASSQVSVPQISPDTGEISEIILIEGRIRLKTAASEEKSLHLKSVFYDLKLPLNLDLFASVDRKQPLARFDIVHGELMAVFFDFEKKQTIKEGESITFNGERDGDTIKYDYLLNGRKAPHGILQPIEKYDVSIYSTQENLEKKIKIEEQEKAKAKELERLKKKRAYENSFLCRKPFGQKDQCFWKKKNEGCFRYRCNVQGQWGDETERPVTELCLSEKVGPCDY